jgi:hypothetical protein
MLFFFQKLCRLWDNVKKISDRSQMTIWYMRIVYLISKATDTHSEYVLFVAFPLQQWLRKRYTYIHCLSLIIYGPYKLQSLKALGVTENTQQ